MTWRGLFSTDAERKRDSQKRRIIQASNDIPCDCFTVSEFAELLAVRGLVPGAPSDSELDRIERRVKELNKAAA